MHRLLPGSCKPSPFTLGGLPDNACSRWDEPFAAHMTNGGGLQVIDIATVLMFPSRLLPIPCVGNAFGAVHNVRVEIFVVPGM